MFQPQPTPFSTFYPSYLTGSLDGQDFSQQQQTEDSNGLQVDNNSYVQVQAQAQAQAQAAAQQAAVEAGGFSNYQQPTFAQAPVNSLLGPVELGYGHQSHSHSLSSQSHAHSQPILNPCSGAGPGSTGGGGHGGAIAGIGAAGAGPRPVHAAPNNVVGPLSLAPQIEALQGSRGLHHHHNHSSAGQAFPLHGAIPQAAAAVPTGASQHHQLPLSQSGPSLFDHTPSPAAASATSNNFHQHHHHHHPSRTPRQHQRQSLRHSHPRYRSYPHRPISVSSGAGSNMDASDQSLQDDMAAQEAAARTWQPDLEGPRVGDKTPIDAITAEYAKADPIYVAKTMALPQTYTHYRPIKGDGSCGWRAIVFSYFEQLIEQGSSELIHGEELRLHQLNDYLVNCGGYDPEMFMDFTEETFQLFKDIADNIQSPEVAGAILETKFNDDSSMGLLYHFRILAASWLKGNRSQYEAWCEAGVDQYVQGVIDPIDREIEELGVVLLVEVLLKPVGFTLEIAYLDRSAGTEVNTHRFPESTANIGGPFIHLLYRPGHYDILYKPNTSQVIQVNRMSYEPSSFAPAPQFASSYDFNPMMMMPGLGSVGAFSNPMGQLGGPSLDFAQSPQSPWFPSPRADSSTAPSTPQVTGPPAYATPQQQESTLPTLPPQQQQPTAPGPSAPQQHEIRFSPYQFDQVLEPNPWPEQSFQTSMFKNSHFNKAHYNNPDFTPEAYNPGADEPGEGRSEKPSRRKGHGKGGRQSSEDSTESK